jgi:hypothetical protein
LGFLEKFIAIRGRVGSFDVRPLVDVGRVGGTTGFQKALESAPQMAGFVRVQHVVLIADSDENEATSFIDVCAQITAANLHKDVGGRYPIPAALGATVGTKLKVTVLLLPGAGLPGALETLLWRAVMALYAKEAACVDTLLACAGIDKNPNKWPSAKLDKARVHAFLSIHNRPNPAVAMGRLWHDAAKGGFPTIIPADHPTFDNLETALARI